MADLKGRPTRMHMGSILVGSCLSITKQSAVYVNREAVMQTDYLANWERLPNYEKLSQTV